VVATWATFAPCFLWIFLGAPYVERLRGNALLSSALSAITAAVVGVVLNLALWFGLHVSFAVLHEVPFAGMRLLVPEVASIQVFSVAITSAAFFVLFRRHWGMIRTLLLSSAAGLVYQLGLRAWLGG
jgi:chromate transporter